MATVVAIVFNYVGFRYFTYRDRDRGGRTREMTLFVLFSAVGDVLAEAVGELPPRQGEPVTVHERVDRGAATADSDGRPGRVRGAGQSRYGDKQGSESLC
ncbi:hypothetical protein EAO69_22760 [Streptomyces sp. me109]|nr:hypothetical protein EAO69_22760 [Streptomyces sp. me109]